MPTEILTVHDLSVGEIYEDCFHHPCLCVGVKDDGEVEGISLVDGSFPRSCDVQNCGIRKLSVEEALKWRVSGPDDATVEANRRWWVPKLKSGPTIS